MTVLDVSSLDINLFNISRWEEKNLLILNIKKIYFLSFLGLMDTMQREQEGIRLVNAEHRIQLDVAMSAQALKASQLHEQLVQAQEDFDRARQVVLQLESQTADSLVNTDRLAVQDAALTLATNENNRLIADRERYVLSIFFVLF